MPDGIEEQHFHVLVETSAKGKYTEKDLKREVLLTRFAIPFLQGKRLQVRGNFVEPSQVQKMYFSSSQKPLDEIIRLHQARIAPNVFYIVGERDSILSQEFCKDITTEIMNEADRKVAEPTQQKVHTSKPRHTNKAKVFVVHGRDVLAKTEVARFLEKSGLEPIILHEQSSGNKTIIEKIESYSDVGFAVVIYSPCDVGGLAGDSTTKPRARQNVVFEHGYFIGHLGRSNVCQLVKGELETPNDISGVVYTAMDEGGRWRFDLAKELRAAGYEIDLNNVF